MNQAELIGKSLSKFLPPVSREPKILHKAMRYSVLPGGKRIRPVILIESAITCGVKAADAIAAACAVEFVHTYSLIHDDLPSMDDDDYRRGRLSCHKKFGEANAILAGDALLTLAFSVLANEYKTAVAVEMVKELSQAIGSEGMVGGQALDIANDKNLKNVNFLKTAKLFEASSVLGALSAGAGKKEIDSMRKYGTNLGVAFQATDDALDGEKHFTSEDVRALADRAKNAVAMFGNKAVRLKEIADYILTRKK